MRIMSIMNQVKGYSGWKDVVSLNPKDYAVYFSLDEVEKDGVLIEGVEGIYTSRSLTDCLIVIAKDGYYIGFFDELNSEDVIACFGKHDTLEEACWSL